MSSRRVYQSDVIIDEDQIFDEVARENALSVISEQASWSIYHASPLYKLQYTQVRLKQYAAKLQQALAQTINDSKPVSVKVHIKIEKDLRAESTDPFGIVIAVSTTNLETNETKTKVYRAIMMTWGQQKQVEEAVHLPYYLEHGSQAIGTTVRLELGKIFDCQFTPFCFTQPQLLVFAVAFLLTDSRKTNKYLTLTYTLPESLNEKIELKWPIADLLHIWNNSDELDDKTDPIEKALTFYKYIQTHTFQANKCDLLSLKLIDVATPTASMKHDGKFKIKSSVNVNQMFDVLNEILMSYQSHNHNVSFSD